MAFAYFCKYSGDNILNQRASKPILVERLGQGERIGSLATKTSSGVFDIPVLTEGASGQIFELPRPKHPEELSLIKSIQIQAIEGGWAKFLVWSRHKHPRVLHLQCAIYKETQPFTLWRGSIKQDSRVLSSLTRCLTNYFGTLKTDPDVLFSALTDLLEQSVRVSSDYKALILGKNHETRHRFFCT